jgi:drug/metabolite transporter (DMT)-like permease
VKRWGGGPVRAAFEGLSADLRASLLLIVAFVLFSAMSVFMRMIGDRIGVPQVILVRQVLTLVMLAPLFWTGRRVVFRPTGLGLHLTRGVLAVGAMACGLTAILHIPFADATAIGMSDALITTALAALILREQVGWRRWTATVVGFVGVLVMIRPFGDGFDSYALVALAGAAFGASSVIALRLGSGHDSTATVMFWQGLVVAILAAPLALVQWVMPTWPEAGVLLVMSVIFAAGNWLLTVGIRLGHAAAIAPLGYLRLLMMAAAGWFIYGEVPSWATVAGGTLVIASATYTLTRNAARDSPTPPPLPPSLP